MLHPMRWQHSVDTDEKSDNQDLYCLLALKCLLWWNRRGITCHMEILIGNPSQHAISGHYQRASETPFEWRLANGRIMARFYMLIWPFITKLFFYQTDWKIPPDMNPLSVYFRRIFCIEEYLSIIQIGTSRIGHQPRLRVVTVTALSDSASWDSN